MDKSEILAHISAPSGAVDDARYRAQVKAILNFQTHSREGITLRADKTPPHPVSSSHPSASLLPKATKSITSPLHVPSLPSPRAPKRPGSQQDSLDTPVSVIPDSQPQQLAFDAESLSLHPEPPLSSPYFSSKRPRVDSLDYAQHDDVQRDSAEHRVTTTPASPIIVNTPSIPSIPGKENDEKQPQQKTSIRLPLPLEIKPPPPPISTSHFTTHITPTLEMLTTRLKSSRTYNPTNQPRVLNNLERGYWYLRINLVPPTPTPEATTPASAVKPDSPTSWDTTLFSRFWTFLSDFISKEGRAGWGVWCILEGENEITAPVPQEADGGESNSTTGLPRSQSVSLKVYTWGEIACHIYLLLFLASERRIRKMGAQWRDARDEVVIQMP